jgi:hypothetical protein
MKAIIIMCVGILLLAFTTAEAAMVKLMDSDPTVALGITGLAINGTDYDVDFSYDMSGYTGPTYDAGFASSAAAAIVNEFNTDGLGILSVGDNNHTEYTFYIADGNSDAVYACGSNLGAYIGPQHITSWITGTLRPDSQYFPIAATLTQTSVPIPGAALLFGSALLMVGFVRNRFNQ